MLKDHLKDNAASKEIFVNTFNLLYVDALRTVMPFCFNDDANDLNPGKNLSIYILSPVPLVG